MSNNGRDNDTPGPIGVKGQLSQVSSGPCGDTACDSLSGTTLCWKGGSGVPPHPTPPG